MTEHESVHHGLSDDGHGPEEHGLGAIPSPEDPRDFAIEGRPEYAAVLAAAFPPSWLEPNSPPVSNQGSTPMCVAYSAANDQGHMDRPESGLYPAFDRPKFFAQIGGGPNGAFIRAALDRRLHFGYPLASAPDQAAAHRIGAYYRVPIAVDAVKAALLVSPRNGGLVVGGPWYHSWFHPLSSGRLPVPDYVAGGHA